ncbi:MAG: sec-independent protein translocase protein TatC [Actinomycetota bacterium]|nr:sec-independent protein translocase protein TatC [Actinomycetota bacterium]
MAAPVRSRPRFPFRRRRTGARVEASMTMMEHLGELRTRLIICAAAFAVVSLIAFFFFGSITNFLLRPLCSLPKKELGPQGCKLIVTGVLEPFLVRLKVTAMVGMIFTSPVWLYQLWAFISPGLRPNEKRLAGPFVGSSVALFGFGGVFAYLTLPFGLGFLLALGGGNLIPFLKADSYLNFVLLLVIVFGVTFELPLLLMFLALAGVVTREQLVSHRKAAFVGAFVIGAVVTPTQDPYTMSAMAIPLYLLYEVVVFILRIRERRGTRL